MIGKRQTTEGWVRDLDQDGRALSLDEYTAQETLHVCGSLVKLVALLEAQSMTLERINGRLDRLELWLGRKAAYPTSQASMTDLAELRERGIPA